MLPAPLPDDAGAVQEELQIALCHLQQFEPAGVGARTPAECLSLQIKNLPDDGVRKLALEIVGKHLELLASRDYTRLKSLTGAGDDALRAAQRLIQALNPRPGSAFAKLEARYVIPDVIVKKSRNVWKASLNPDAMPRLRINSLYAQLAAAARSGAGISSQLQEARWLIKNVQQRFDTILRVSQAIVDRQRHFLEHGEVAMRPLVLREIASTLSLHESTISRVTTQKFMATPRGTFELKYFFGSHVATEAGGAASSTAIRALIKQLVAAEDTKAPLSDARISQILGEQGIVVARRTIAKYRESLQIPPVNQRKAFNEKGLDMNLNVSGHHLEVTPAIRSYVESKIARITRHFDHVIDAHVILTANKQGQKAEVTLHVRGKDLHCESEEGDLYAAIDLLADKLDRQVLRYKDKLYEKRV